LHGGQADVLRVPRAPGPVPTSAEVVHGAALNVGVQLIEIREAIYQLAPFIGFPCTLNAMATVNDVFRARGCRSPSRARCVSELARYELDRCVS
jgi:hypothetical protein